MKEVFLEKLKNQNYISYTLYLEIAKTEGEIIPNDFEIESYNNHILEKEYLKYQDYFNRMYQNIDNTIHLDKEQIKAILADEDYSLIIAGAGTGKTTTMASKVKYLSDIKKVSPEKIAVMSFTKKATEELEKRINIDFNLNAKVTTFHSLGLAYIREIFYNRKCYVVDENLQNQIFLDYFQEKIFPEKERVAELIQIFSPSNIQKAWVFGNYFKNNYKKYNTYKEFFSQYKRDKISSIQNIKAEVDARIENSLNQEVIYTINQEIVKSRGEALIANFLFCNGIEYQYEKLYEKLMPERRSYKPDFTLNLKGEEVYIEYFGLSNYQSNELSRYDKIRRQKELYHYKHKTKLIKLDYIPGENMINTLKQELIKMGFILKPKTPEEILDTMLSNNPTSQFYPLKNFFYQQIEKIKSSPQRLSYQQVILEYLKTLPLEERKQAERQCYYINDFYLYYQNKLYNALSYGFDYSDMIYYANEYLNTISTNTTLDFEYLIIDEYQDISRERYEFTKNIANKCHAKVVAVGDDWQSIYAFTGSKIEYIYNFQKYFKGAKLFQITKTYRNSQQLIDYSGNFIMKNKNQIQKQLISNKQIINPIRFIMFNDGEEEYALKNLILTIHAAHPSHKIMILARTNRMIKNLYRDVELKEAIGTKIEFIGYEEIQIDAMTIHKSKGLTCDEVILIGLDKSFPHASYGTFWLSSLFAPKNEIEPIPFAEERRVFYVGLTRTKNYVYLLVNRNSKNRSPFLNELLNLMQEKDNEPI